MRDENTKAAEKARREEEAARLWALYSAAEEKGEAAPSEAEIAATANAGAVRRLLVGWCWSGAELVCPDGGMVMGPEYRGLYEEDPTTPIRPMRWLYGAKKADLVWMVHHCWVQMAADW